MTSATPSPREDMPELPEPLARLLEYADESDSACYGTLSTRLVRQLLNEYARTALASRSIEPGEWRQQAHDAIESLLDAMDMQEKRERDEFHIPGETALCIWRDAQEKGRAALAAPGGEDDRKDAQRYRRIRDEDIDTSRLITEGWEGAPVLLSGAELDAAIDSAMAAKEGSQHE